MGDKQGESKKYAATNNHKIVKSNAIFHNADLTGAPE